MRVVIVDKKEAKLKLENKTLKVDTQKIPLRLIDTLILSGSYHVETKEFIKMTQEDVNIILISNFSNNSAIITNTKSKNAQLKLQQYNAQKNSLEIAKYFLTHKIKSHAKHLQSIDIKTELDPIIENIKNATTLQTLLGIEGSFSKYYFTNYFKLFPKHLHSNKRTKNPPLDPINATMSFLYMLFYNFISIKLISFGFEPSIGFLHKAFRSHNALSSDFMELVRADINAFVHTSFKDGKLQTSDFSKKGGVYLKYDGRKKLWSDIKALMDRFDPKIDTEVANLRAMF